MLQSRTSLPATSTTLKVAQQLKRAPTGKDLRLVVWADGLHKGELPFWLVEQGETGADREGSLVYHVRKRSI